MQDFKAALKLIEPHIRAVKPLWNGRPFRDFSLRAREFWSLWLLCSVMNSVHQKSFTFFEDDRRDGILVDFDAEDWIHVENKAVMTFNNVKPPHGERGIIDEIQKSIDKAGEQYQRGVILTIFYDGVGEMYANRVARHFYGRHSYEGIYLIGLINDHGGQQYSYSVSELYDQDSSIYRIDIAPDFSSWKVTQIQRSSMDNK